MSKQAQTQVQPTSQPSFSPVSSGLLQRKCDCGQSAGLTGKCGECEGKGLTLQRKLSNQGEQEAPPIMHDVLRSSSVIQPKLKIGAPNDKYEKEADRIAKQVVQMPELSVQRQMETKKDKTIQTKASNSPPTATKSFQVGMQNLSKNSGQPLPIATREFMEARFKRDFSNVRIHTDEQAVKSAQEIEARAFTMGQNIFFGNNEFQPNTKSGRQILAHELTHTIQQNQSIGLTLQRAKKKKENKARISKMVLNPRFAHKVWERTSLKVKDLVLQEMRGRYGEVWVDEFLTLQENGFRGEGFLDEHYIPTSQPPAPSDEKLKYRGYVRVYRFQTLPNEYFEQWLRPSGQIITIIREGQLVTESESQESTQQMEEEIVNRPVCGPNVTEEIISAMTRAGAAFDALNSGDQADSCAALVFILEGALGSWDIIQLYRNNNGWIHQIYRPPCASRGANPVCGITVQVGNQCYDSGAANYVLFGYYMRKCFDVYGGKYPAVRHLYTRSTMLDLIDEYKGPESILGEGGNYRTARQWSEAGYAGWPNGGTPPPGNYQHCQPVCPTRFLGPNFQARWCPHIDPADQCPITRVAAPS